MDRTTNATVIFISSDIPVDGGGFWIDENGHVHRVPPWSVDVLAQLTVGTTLLHNARQILDANLSRQLENVAAEVITSVMPRVEEHLGSGIR